MREPGEKSVSLDSVMATYLQRLEEGESPDPGEYTLRYPQYADELKEFFRNFHWFGDDPLPSADNLVGARIGPYEIECEIARGGMGVVYRAHQKGLQRPVAIKLISSGVLAGREERSRFRIEAEAAARLEHPGIIAIHEIGSWQGYEYFSMTLVEGPTLQRHVESGEFDDKQSACWLRDVARAVAYAHDAGIIHRDLKPDNILLSEDGRPLVTDFGLAKWHRDGTLITRTGQVLGTPNYMSPEQAAGRAENDTAGDIYSLGAILYALLTGKPPHTGHSAAEVLRSVLQDEPAAPRQIRRDASPELEKICLKAIRRDPAERYPTASALADDLERFLAGESTSAAGSGLLDRVAREIRRDQHQDFFEDWGWTLSKLGWIIFAAHAAMFVLGRFQFSPVFAYWLPRCLMLAAVAAVIYRARDGAVLPRTVAERPVWSIWLGYLATLAVMNLLYLGGGTDRTELFPIASALSGFGFIAMSGHIWGGAALMGFAFYGVAILCAIAPVYSALIFGGTWWVSLEVLALHYRGKNSRHAAHPSTSRG